MGLGEKLQRLQNRAARVITGSTFHIRSVDVLNMLGWESLDQRRNYTKSIYMYKITNDHAAPNLKQLFDDAVKAIPLMILGIVKLIYSITKTKERIS
jgi:hypothetical protein